MDMIFSNKINLLKALAIILVVSGHLEFSLFGMFPPYSFQLALFFFISGMLFKEKYINDMKTFFQKRVKSLLIPYFCYELFYLIITYFLYKQSGEFLGDEISLKSFFITPFINGHQLLLCAPLWFVPQLFLSLCAFVILMKLLNKFQDKWHKLCLFSILGFGAIPLFKYVGNSIVSLMVMKLMFSLFFIYIGYFYSKYVKDKIDIFQPKYLGFILVFQSVLWLFNRDFDPTHGIGLSYVLVWGRFDNQLIVPVLTAITGIWFSLFFIEITYSYFKDIKLLKDIGNNTYHIMANHTFVMFIITVLLCHYNHVHIDFRNDKIYTIFDPVQTTYLYFVLVLLITTYIGKFQKYVYAKCCLLFLTNGVGNKINAQKSECKK